MKITIPEFSLVVLIGASGAGKSTFARQHFLPTEVVSSDACRAMVSDDENDLSATADAFDLLHTIAAKRLARRRLTVIDATNVQKEARQPLLALARAYHTLPVAIVLDMPASLCLERNAGRPDRATMKPYVVHRHRRDLRRSLKQLRREGFNRVYVLSSPQEVAAASVSRERLWTDKRDEPGPFDIIGDVHSCFDELLALLAQLGYEVSEDADVSYGYAVTPPPGRRALFLGDYVDRGPKPVQTLRLVMSMAAQGVALCLPGNHDVKLQKALQGRQVQRRHGLAETMAAMEETTDTFREDTAKFIRHLLSHYVLDDGKLVVAHAGLKESLQGRASAKVREFALYGDTTGETDDYGLPVRRDWGADYRGEAFVVYGHTPVAQPAWVNRTINIDTGCCFGGALTALRYPELELVSVPAQRQYAVPGRPFRDDDASSPLTAQQQVDDILDLADVMGKRTLHTRLLPRITIREANSIPALEVMSRFAINPKWLIYLPPTMSPPATSTRSGLLEHPDEAFAYFRQQGVEQVVCEEKHMGSRALLVVCRDKEAATRHFGVLDEGIGVCYTRSGRRFFGDAALENAFLDRVRAAVSTAGLWDELRSDWLLLDAELMPWSLKAQELLESQYAAVGAAGESALQEGFAALEKAAAHGADVSALLDRYQDRAAEMVAYRRAYRPYCWPITQLTDLSLAPFHLLASAGAVHVDKNHLWHMEILARLAAVDPALILATPYRAVDLADEASVNEATAWWEAVTASGGEGMVVKPRSFVVKGPKGLVQPAIKCRGRDYLRLIYGPEYALPVNLERLRLRRLGRKRSLARREFALGIEALERFVEGAPLRRVHECVFGVLALETEPVDPRL